MASRHVPRTGSPAASSSAAQLYCRLTPVLQQDAPHLLFSGDSDDVVCRQRLKVQSVCRRVISTHRFRVVVDDDRRYAHLL